MTTLNTASNASTESTAADAGHSLRPRAALEVGDESAEAGTDHVLIRIAGGRYAIAATDVAEVVQLLELTRLPGAPSWLPGIGNWRGHVLPVLDLRPLLDVPVSPSPSSARVVVLSVDEIEIGVLTDAVTGLAAIPDECPAPPVTVGEDAALLLRALAPGDDAGPIGVLDTAALLGLQERLPRQRRRT